MNQRQPRVRDETHLRFVRLCACLGCGNPVATEAAHVRMSVAGVKVNPGVGQKPDDRWVVPLCSQCHRDQHSMSERAFWECKGIDPLAVARDLYAVSGDHAAASRIIATARMKARPVNILAAG